MKKILLVLLLLPLIAPAQTDNGIRFQSLSWSQLLQKAKAENKLIFVDAYTTWCGPCKKMASDVFTDARVGAFFNSNYINAKIDMEEGEGVRLAEQYQVASYPTFLFVDGNGKLVHRSIGYRPASEFIQTGQDGLNPNRQFYTLREKFSQGTLSGDPLYYLAKIGFEMEDPKAPDFAKAYLKNQQDCLTRPCIELMLAMAENTESPYFQLISKNEKAARETAGDELVRDGLNRIAYASVVKNAGIGPEEPIRSAMAKLEYGMKKIRPAREARRFALSYGMYMAGENEDKALASELEAAYITEFGDELGWSELNEYAWNAYLNETDKVKLQAALKWGLQSVSKESNFYNNDTVAHLYYKLGNKKDARKYAETALKLGKAAGEDVKETEELLKKL